jgi:hypothetical protein
MVNRHVSFTLALVIIITYAFGIGVLVRSVSRSVQNDYDETALIYSAHAQK